MALETADGRWRVEVVQHGREVRYRLLEHGEVVPQPFTIGQIQQRLQDEGVSMADLVDVTDRLAAPGRD